MVVKRILTLWLLWAVMVSPAFAADVAKIGMVDMQKVLQESQSGRDAAEALRKIQARRNEELGRMREKIAAVQATLDSGTLSADRSASARQELEGLVDAFKQADDAFRRQMGEVNRRRTERIRADVRSIIERLGRKGGYLLIVEKGQVLYAPASMDMTDRLISLYDKEYEKR